jgi:DNA-binding Lrp family transcriptional regulator
LNPGSSDGNKGITYPSAFRGREGKLNVQIIRILAQKGPSIIYAIAQQLKAESETKIHYPTVNRRVHQLLRAGYIEKAGTKLTKAGANEYLYALALRGEFAALAGMPDWKGGYLSEPSPSEIRQLLSTASARKKSPFALLNQISQQDQDGADLVQNKLAPELVRGVRGGFIDLDATEEDTISTSFAKLVARTIIDLSGRNGSSPKPSAESKPLRMLMDALDKPTLLVENDTTEGPASLDHQDCASQHWAKELRVYLKLYSVKFE